MSTFQYTHNSYKPKSLSGSGPNPSQGLGEYTCGMRWV